MAGDYTQKELEIMQEQAIQKAKEMYKRASKNPVEEYNFKLESIEPPPQSKSKSTESHTIHNVKHPNSANYFGSDGRHANQSRNNNLPSFFSNNTYNSSMNNSPKSSNNIQPNSSTNNSPKSSNNIQPNSSMNNSTKSSNNIQPNSSTNNSPKSSNNIQPNSSMNNSQKPESGSASSQADFDCATQKTSKSKATFDNYPSPNQIFHRKKQSNNLLSSMMENGENQQSGAVDEDKMLIISLVLLLSCEKNTDTMLVLALLYILM